MKLKVIKENQEIVFIEFDLVKSIKEGTQLDRLITTSNDNPNQAMEYYFTKDGYYNGSGRICIDD